MKKTPHSVFYLLALLLCHVGSSPAAGVTIKIELNGVRPGSVVVETLGGITDPSKTYSINPGTYKVHTRGNGFVSAVFSVTDIGGGSAQVDPVWNALNAIITNSTDVLKFNGHGIAVGLVAESGSAEVRDITTLSSPGANPLKLIPGNYTISPRDNPTSSGEFSIDGIGRINIPSGNALGRFASINNRSTPRTITLTGITVNIDLDAEDGSATIAQLIDLVKGINNVILIPGIYAVYPRNSQAAAGKFRIRVSHSTPAFEKPGDDPDEFIVPDGSRVLLMGQQIVLVTSSRSEFDLNDLLSWTGNKRLKLIPGVYNLKQKVPIQKRNFLLGGDRTCYVRQLSYSSGVVKLQCKAYCVSWSDPVCSEYEFLVDSKNVSEDRRTIIGSTVMNRLPNGKAVILHLRLKFKKNEPASNCSLAVWAFRQTRFNQFDCAQGGCSNLNYPLSEKFGQTIPEDGALPWFIRADRCGLKWDVKGQVNLMAQ